MSGTPERPASGSTSTTAILDWQSEEITQFIHSVKGSNSPSQIEALQTAHRFLSKAITPVYAIKDRQSVSQTLRLGRGSCSQRTAVLEAFARSQGIQTRVRGLLINGKFWYPRFPLLKFVVPREVILAWPEFELNGQWLSMSELFGNIDVLATSGLVFTNAGAETLFDAVAETAVDWDGKTSITCPASGCDLSGYIVQDFGRFSSRDELFDVYGETLCGPMRNLLNPFLSRWSPTKRS